MADVGIEVRTQRVDPEAEIIEAPVDFTLEQLGRWVLGLPESVLRKPAVFVDPSQPDPAIHERTLARGLLQYTPDIRLLRFSDDSNDQYLTGTENGILELLTRTPGVVRTRPDIIESVWGASDRAQKHTVDIHVVNTRRKLGEVARMHLHTVRGAGFVWREDT